MDVKGNGNRVAQRDYYENLTITQIQEAGIEPCPSCGVRVVKPGTQACNHCVRQREEKKFLDAAFTAGVGFFILVTIGWFLAIRFGAHGLEAFQQALAIAAILFVALWALNVIAWKWIIAAPTMKLANLRHGIISLSCCALGLACLLLNNHLNEDIRGWVLGFGFLPLMFGLVLGRKQPRSFF
ncbi:MAG: hypothetical protein CL536_01670 [Alcaligenaceae bacterium]|nr:hypothetical protein [Alcaligenaceae bacterium]